MSRIAFVGVPLPTQKIANSPICTLHKQVPEKSSRPSGSFSFPHRSMQTRLQLSDYVGLRMPLVLDETGVQSVLRAHLSRPQQRLNIIVLLCPS